jgi:putative hydrolase of the HAD superfamily
VAAVIFDIGGILEPPFDDVLFPELARMLGVPEPRLRARREEDAAALSTGRMTLRDFYARVVAEDGRPVDPDATVARHLAVYEAATSPLDPDVLALIAELRRRYAVACLSNTEVEVARFNRSRGLFDPFHRAFLSAELGLVKPGRAIFEHALAELRCQPAAAVFTDDRLDNVAGARAAGIPSIHYRGFEEFRAQLQRLLEPGRPDRAG